MNKMKKFPLKFNKEFFPNCEWKYIPSTKIYVHQSEQGTQSWLNSRKGRLSRKELSLDEDEHKNIDDKPCIPIRITASKFSVCDLYEPNPFQNADDLALELIGLKKKEFTKEAISNMNHGTKYEPRARKIYEDYTKNEVTEWGLAVPKWDIHIGASVDGVVGEDGMIEIKCPKKMYKPIMEYVRMLNGGWKPPNEFYRGHIWKSHYDQMQGGMAILGKKWCDYVVYCQPEDYFYRERILFNANYWNNCLYPNIKHFYQNILHPLIEETYFRDT